jgi:CRP/FNR family cyclic AMP-dependent transcriptional regulator
LVRYRTLSIGLRSGRRVCDNQPVTFARTDSAMAKKSKAKFDPEAFLAKADGGVTISKYRKGQVVFAQGEPADSVFYIREGRVKIAVVSEQGKEAVVTFLKAGDFIGEGCLTGRPRRVSTARAVEDSVVTRLDKTTMMRMLGDEPKFSERFTAYLLARTLRVEEDLVDQLFNSSEKRLARALLLLANFGEPLSCRCRPRRGGNIASSRLQFRRLRHYPILLARGSFGTPQQRGPASRWRFFRTRRLIGRSALFIICTGLLPLRNADVAAA